MAKYLFYYFEFICDIQLYLQNWYNNGSRRPATNAGAACDGINNKSAQASAARVSFNRASKDGEVDFSLSSISLLALVPTSPTKV